MFQQPRDSGDKAPIAEMVGSLVLIVVREYRTGIITTLKPGGTDAVACDVHCLDGQHGGEVFTDALLFQGALVGSLKGAAGGEPVLGRIAQGIAKPSQNPPYILQPFTDADAAIAGPYWARVQSQQFQAPAPAAPPVQQQAPAAAAYVPPAAPVAPPAAAPAIELPGGMLLDAYLNLQPEVQRVIFPSFPETARALLRQAYPQAVPAGV